MRWMKWRGTGLALAPAPWAPAPRFGWSWHWLAICSPAPPQPKAVLASASALYFLNGGRALQWGVHEWDSALAAWLTMGSLDAGGWVEGDGGGRLQIPHTVNRPARHWPVCTPQFHPCLHICRLMLLHASCHTVATAGATWQHGHLDRCEGCLPSPSAASTTVNNDKPIFSALMAPIK